MGLFDSLFGIKGSAKPSSPMTAAMAERVVRDYGAVLQSRAPVTGTVADARELPYPKERIKQALVIALRSTADPRVRESLKIGYISLADWQEGVGLTPVGIDLTKIDPTEDVLELAKRVAAQGEGMDKWIAAMKAEQEALADELRQMGLW